MSSSSRVRILQGGAGNSVYGLRCYQQGPRPNPAASVFGTDCLEKSVPSSIVVVVGSRPAGGLEAGELARWKGLLFSPAPVGLKALLGFVLLLNCL